MHFWFFFVKMLAFFENLYLLQQQTLWKIPTNWTEKTEDRLSWFQHFFYVHCVHYFQSGSHGMCSFRKMNCFDTWKRAYTIQILRRFNILHIEMPRWYKIYSASTHTKRQHYCGNISLCKNVILTKELEVESSKPSSRNDRVLEFRYKTLKSLYLYLIL